MAALAFTGRLGVFGTGYGDLSHALQEGMIWKVAGLLLVAKWAATVACYGSGGCGGIFSPCLFFGAMSGTMLTGLFGPVLALTDSDRVLVAAGGMSACLGAVVQAPVTAILIIFEMTHQFSAGARLDARRVVEPGGGPPPRQGELLRDRIAAGWSSYGAHYSARDLKSWQNLPVSAIARSIPW